MTGHTAPSHEQDALDEAVGRLTELAARFYDAEDNWEMYRGSKSDAADLRTLLAALVEMRGENERLKGLLEEAAEVLDRYSGTSQEPGDSQRHPNAAMRMMCEINEELGL